MSIRHPAPGSPRRHLSTAQAVDGLGACGTRASCSRLDSGSGSVLSTGDPWCPSLPTTATESMPFAAPAGEKQGGGCRYNGQQGGNGEVVNDHLGTPQNIKYLMKY